MAESTRTSQWGMCAPDNCRKSRSDQVRRDGISLVGPAGLQRAADAGLGQLVRTTAEHAARRTASFLGSGEGVYTDTPQEPREATSRASRVTGHGRRCEGHGSGCLPANEGNCVSDAVRVGAKKKGFLAAPLPARPGAPRPAPLAKALPQRPSAARGAAAAAPWGAA